MRTQSKVSQILDVCDQTSSQSSEFDNPLMMDNMKKMHQINWFKENYFTAVSGYQRHFKKLNDLKAKEKIKQEENL